MNAPIRTRSSADERFDPEPYEAELSAIIAELSATEFGDLEPSLDARGLDRILRRHPKDGRGFFSKRELLAGVHFLSGRRGKNLDVARLTRLLRTCPTRSRSGILPVTVLTQPFPCPGECIFCPNDVRMPKSYLADEPGCQRAEAHEFDPYRQTSARLLSYARMGHRTDKVELIVLGGTWSAYPEEYQRWFTRRMLDALNEFSPGREVVSDPEVAVPEYRSLDRLHPPEARAGRYNGLLSEHLKRAEAAGIQSVGGTTSWEELAAAQHRNETSASRCVGLVFETRPDRVTDDEVLRLRRLGATKIQLGVQSLDDQVLAQNRRGHDAESSRRAIALLRRAGFKIHVHWMANLLGSTPVRDARDFERLFDDPGIRPDELKLYPCSLIEGTELMAHYRSGAWRAYTREELVELLSTCLAGVPRYCRVTRVVRDIPSPYIVDGNRETNFREVAERHLREQGRQGQDIRAREIGFEPVDPAELRLRSLEYGTRGARERFLEFVTPGDQVVAFLRLSLPDTPAAPKAFAEIAGCALIRELHVYGEVAGLRESGDSVTQHRGFGRRLLDEASRIAREERYSGLAVISAVGTRGYYRRLGFEDGVLYQRRSLTSASPTSPSPAPSGTTTPPS